MNSQVSLVFSKIKSGNLDFAVHIEMKIMSKLLCEVDSHGIKRRYTFDTNNSYVV